MSAMKVTARLGKGNDGPSTEVEYDFGDNLEAAVKLFGEEVVFSKFKAACVIDLQGRMRNLLSRINDEDEEKRVNIEDIPGLLADWKPSVREPGKSKVERASSLIDGMSEEDRKALLAQLQGGNDSKKKG